MRNLISTNIEVGELKGVGPLGTNLITDDQLAPTRAGAYLNVIINLLIVGAGIYALLNFILAGYGYLSAGGDPKKIQEASANIWQSIVGLVIVAGSFLIAALIGYLVFKDANALLFPQITLPF